MSLGEEFLRLLAEHAATDQRPVALKGICRGQLRLENRSSHFKWLELQIGDVKQFVDEGSISLAIAKAVSFAFSQQHGLGNKPEVGHGPESPLQGFPEIDQRVVVGGIISEVVGFVRILLKVEKCLWRGRLKKGPLHCVERAGMKEIPPLPIRGLAVAVAIMEAVEIEWLVAAVV